MNRRIAWAVFMTTWWIIFAAIGIAVIASSACADPPAPPADGTCTTGTTAAPGSYPAVSCLNKTWHCSSLQRSTQVNVRIVSPPTKLDAIHLDSGCTGRIRVTIQTNSGDGIKLHQGAHDLQVWGGAVRPGASAIVCTGKTGIVHQDGVQAMGGEHVLFPWFRVWCPTGNNGGMFFNGGNGGPHDVICDHCDLMEGNTAFNIGPLSHQSGVRFSKLHTGRTPASPKNCRRIDPTADGPIDEGNTCLTPK